jgi:hypothetical protein
LRGLRLVKFLDDERILACTSCHNLDPCGFVAGGRDAIGSVGLDIHAVWVVRWSVFGDPARSDRR